MFTVNPLQMENNPRGQSVVILTDLQLKNAQSWKTEIEPDKLDYELLKRAGKRGDV